LFIYAQTYQRDCVTPHLVVYNNGIWPYKLWSENTVRNGQKWICILPVKK